MDKRDTTKFTLSVTEFAKLCNTTRDTLRHYHESGLLIPHIDETNGYSYYAPTQASTFFYIKSFRNAGCSLKEINDMMHNFDQEKMIKVANDKVMEMHQELFRINNNIAALNLSLWLLKQYDHHHDNVPYKDSINNFWITKTEVDCHDDPKHAGDLAEDLIRHFHSTNHAENLTIFPTGASIKYDDLIKGNYKYSDIITITPFSIHDENTFSVPSNTAVCCYHDHETEDITITYKKILSYIKRNKLKACSDLNIISFINLYNAKKAHTYFKYMFICVEDEPSL